ncbi:PAS domain-containing protein [Laspinema olomoucense]|uniref:PAS domain-containing protein n=1 Tax=Laspinema olomoucense TaxID=3231600 RepID=UPI0021BAD8C5|nr:MULTISPECIES: PAS domain-containing protein [unclassified Laspinema]MCT7991372.1 PAS domain-containing protein [Laspinema sp. D3a]MCT7996211.1 PAS domain-containing protein [Laspinema sp. D3c]
MHVTSSNLPMKPFETPGFDGSPSSEHPPEENEALLESIVNNIPGAIYRCTYQGNWKIAFISKGIEEISGYPVSHFLHHPCDRFKTLVHPEDQGMAQQTVEEALLSQQPYTLDYRIIKADGRIGWVREIGQGICDRQGNLCGLDGTLSPLGDLPSRHFDQTIPEFSPKIAPKLTILEQIKEGFLNLNSQGQVIYINPQGEKLLQTSRPTLCQPGETRELPPELAQFFADLKTALLGPNPRPVEACYPYKETWLEVRTHPYDSGILVFLSDITARKQVLNSLRQRENLYRTFVKNFPNGVILLFDRDLHHTLAEGRDLEAIHLIKTTVEGKTLQEAFPSDICQTLEPLYREVLAGETRVTELTFGSRIYLAQILPIKNEAGEVLGGMVMTQDMTECKLAEAENARLIASLQKSEAKTRAMASLLSEAEKLAHVGCWEFEIATNRIICSDEVYRMLGLDLNAASPTYPEYLQRIHPEDRETAAQLIERAIDAGESYQVEQRIVQSDGSIRYLSANGEPIFNEVGEVVKVLGSLLDITDRHLAQQALMKSEAQLELRARELEETLYELQRTQTQLIQTERMSGLGQMVAGIAHEVNNPVGFIYGNIVHATSYIDDLVNLVNLYQKHYPEPDPEILEEIEEIDLEFLFEDLPRLLRSMKVGAERIREIVRSLRNFSRLDEADNKQVNIHEGIDSTLLILQHHLKDESLNSNSNNNITVIKEYGDLPRVDCYPSELNQVFLNIITNAIDVLKPQDPPRQITIRTEAVIRDQTSSEQSSPDWIIIRIIDNGPGMTPEIQQRMFDPFFTTKPVGMGTGLGLSISYQIIVEQHKGKLTCSSELGKGTELIIELPLHQNHEEPALFE